MRYKENIAIILVATLLIVCGCAKTDISDFSDNSQNGETIECAVSFSVAPMDMGTEDSSDDLATRAADTDTGVDETSIKNLWVVQFNVDNDVIGVKYISDATDLSEVTLIPTSKSSTVYYIANTFDTNLPIFEGMSVDEVEALGRNLYSIDDVINTDSEGNEYLLMSGLYVYENGTTAASESVGIVLSRNVAKINFSVEVGSDIGLEIKDIKVCAIPQNLNYIFGDEDIYPVLNDFTTFTYDVDYSTIENNTITFYMPENRRGTTTSSSESEKAEYAPINATYVEVYAEYTDGDATGSRIYTFYLGENFVNDFNITHNTQYNYQINFNSIGEPETDSRIEDFAPIVDFTGESSSNCYILNPGSSTSRVFYIPIADRINTFWGNNGYEDVADNVITETSELVCEIIWGDNYTPNSDNTGFENITIERETYNSKNAIKATLDYDIPYGNIVVGVRRSTSTNYLWSWHLWITDYNPDTGMVAQDGVYRYQVPGGEIHRYKDASGYTIWSSGDLKGKFIMDRNIGQIDGDADWNATSLLYQYGRKDPFPGYLNAKKPDGSTCSSATNSEYFTTDYYESIYRPNIFFMANSSITAWCNDTKYNSSSYRWCDPNLTTSSTAKSLFDPSPLGWKVMKSETIRDFVATDDSANLISNNSNSCSYYIDGELVETYYITGLTINSTAAFSSGYRGLFWASDSRGLDIRIYPSAPSGSTICNIAASNYSYGFQLRCVQE